MSAKKALLLLVLAFILDAPLVAQLEPAPSFTISAVSNTGIVLSRRLTLSPPLSCAQAGVGGGDAANCPYNVYTLVDSTMLP